MLLYIMSTETPDVSPQGADTAVTFTTTGRVKWFNNKAGYGFITVTSGEHQDIDVFVHHSAITVEHEQYRYLVQGEYVNFNMCEVEDQSHKWQAGDVKGMHGGKLMCETRLESRDTRGSRPLDNDQISTRRPNRDSGPPRMVRSRGQGPRDGGDEWMLVRRRPRYSTQSPSREVLKGRNTRQPPGGA